MQEGFETAANRRRETTRINVYRCLFLAFVRRELTLRKRNFSRARTPAKFAIAMTTNTKARHQSRISLE